MRNGSWKAVLAGLWIACGLVSVGALAQEAIPTPEVSALVSGGSAVEPGLNRPFLFLTDPSLPSPGHVIMGAGLGSITRTGEARPIGAGPLLPTFSAEVGLLSHLSAYLEGQVAFDSQGASAASNFGLEVGAHVLLTDPRSRDVRVAMQASFGRDFSGSSRLLVNGTAAWDIQRLRLAGSVSGSHNFADSADGLDVNGVMAASYLLPSNFRLGGEMIAQDLEEMWAPRAEGGTSVFVGPTVGWEFAHRFEIVAGPMFGVTTGASQVLARGAASVLF